MREGITIEVSATDRARLEAIVADRNAPQKHVWRAEIILATAEALGTNAIMRRVGVSKRCVWRWQARFAAEGVEGLLRAKTRPPGTPPLPQVTVERVVELTRQAPPGEVTHWTGRAMAKVVGISLSAVQAIGKAHGLVPHRVRTFKLSKDPEFITKLRDIVGLYMSPPMRWCCRWTRRARSRRSIARSPGCGGFGRRSASWGTAGAAAGAARGRPGPAGAGERGDRQRPGGARRRGSRRPAAVLRGGRLRSYKTGGLAGALAGQLKTA